MRGIQDDATPYSEWVLVCPAGDHCLVIVLQLTYTAANITVELHHSLQKQKRKLDNEENRH